MVRGDLKFSPEFASVVQAIEHPTMASSAHAALAALVH